MTSLLIFMAWLLSLRDSNTSTGLCIVLFVAMASSCSATAAG